VPLGDVSCNPTHSPRWRRRRVPARSQSQTPLSHKGFSVLSPSRPYTTRILRPERLKSLTTKGFSPQPATRKRNRAFSKCTELPRRGSCPSAAKPHGARQPTSQSSSAGLPTTPRPQADPHPPGRDDHSLARSDRAACETARASGGLERASSSASFAVLEPIQGRHDLDVPGGSAE